MKLPVAKEGYKFIKLSLIFVIGSYILGTLSWIFYLVTCYSLLVTCFLLYFFRDPERKITFNKNHILSPADGKIISILETATGKTVKIFLSPFDVHIQRAPVTGKVTSIEYRPGKFLCAFRLEAQAVNEQNIIEVSSEDTLLKLIQIAGVFARRILCWVRQGNEIIQGERIGMILFGSQVVLELSKDVVLKIKSGDKVKAGLTVIAEKNSA